MSFGGWGCGGRKKSDVSNEKSYAFPALQDWPWYAFVVFVFIFFVCLKKVNNPLSKMLGLFLLIFVLLFSFFKNENTRDELPQAS